MKTVNTNINRVCGVVNSGQQLKPYEWKITVHPAFTLSINFTHFHLPISKACEQTYLFLHVPGKELTRVSEGVWSEVLWTPSTMEHFFPGISCDCKIFNGVGTGQELLFCYDI